MKYTLTLSPDFNTKYLAGWFVFNTWLQKRLGLPIHLELFTDFPACHAAIDAGKIDLIYANPADGAMLLREKQFVPVVHPRMRPDETIIAVPADSPVTRIEDFHPDLRVAATDDPEINMIGQILLEPADITPADIQYQRCENYVLVAKALMNGKADAGFFLAETFAELSPTIRNRLRVILKSQIHVIHHLFLAGPRLTDQVVEIRQALLAMNDTEPCLLKEIGITGWQATDGEEAEFMVDLMDTLID
ncbi:phosphate/phosphite/phosphonate ABC transporter substrate-binding protein [Sulfuricystis multivorans]|uniref:phosphate/phosphite/phosphonate ABC transporter substrate-binding protein n=1 Tax=Sulfuricystis multivorans TaxID=2211108 RepID=UPI000F82AC6A|nr:phosphate/phosphite/phosphonate ABC transporter substrate-binding protein [Sulfuricystis multivorans]